MALHPALDVAGADHDLVLALADDYSPTAADAHGQSLSIFFASAAARDLAAAALASALPAATISSLDVDDEDWAARSQAGLTAVTVGRVTIIPSPPTNRAADDQAQRASGGGEPAAFDATRESQFAPDGRGPIVVVIHPSMGFGTGHHATTRLCLAALQRVDLDGRTLLDAGTGSGVLALAARRLGARRALGLDADPDAIQNALENLELNPDVDAVTFQVADLLEAALPQVDVITANLTGALLCRAAPRLLGALFPGGHLIVSGLLAHERADVLAALTDANLLWEGAEEEWVALCVQRR